MAWRRLWMLVTASGFSMMLTFDASGQSPEEKIEVCRAEDVLTERIACLEAALREDVLSSETLPAPSVSVPVTAIVETPAPVSEVTELGADQIAARAGATDQKQRDNSRQTFTVASTRLVPIEKLEVTLANGQVWRQTRGDSRVIKVSKRYKDSLTVDIWRASISGYRMRLNEMRKTIRVERIK